MEGQNQTPQPREQMEILPVGPSSLCVSFSRRVLKMHQVAEIELDAIASVGNSLNLAFFGIMFGAFVAFGITVLTVDIGDPLHHAAFAALTWVSGALALYFGIRATLDHRVVSKKLKDIKSSTIDSLTTATHL